MSLMYQPKRHFYEEDIRKELSELYSEEISNKIMITDQLMIERSQLEYEMHHDAVDIIVVNGDEVENFFKSEIEKFYYFLISQIMIKGGNINGCI